HAHCPGEFPSSFSALPQAFFQRPGKGTVVMKLRCQRAPLQTAFQIVSGVVPTRTPKEILKNVKLEVAGGVATLIGTDQEVGIRYQIPSVETDSAGETLLPTNRVISILRELTDDSVEFEISED